MAKPKQLEPLTIAAAMRLHLAECATSRIPLALDELLAVALAFEADELLSEKATAAGVELAIEEGERIGWARKVDDGWLWDDREGRLF